ncbi:MAG: exodeoxyribonuclease VII small subunit [Clostridia bacterium]|nr:exodeoxyribonuclease VII small subunit [Clostridia bacterium]
MADNKFEKSLGELEKIVETLEKGETILDESIELFEKGMKISKACRENLDNVKQKIITLTEAESEQRDED